ncbi:MAG: hypothetical protein P4L99_13535 [Chthoniobacter sp.]|nr:hypothetical protein [Chthoniobacter sp.]
MNNRLNDGSEKMAGGSAARQDVPAIPIALTTDPFRFTKRTIPLGFVPARIRMVENSGTKPTECFRQLRNTIGRGRVWHSNFS